MLIGALIGLVVSLTLSWFEVFALQAKVNKHNSSALKIAAYGRAKLNFYWHVFVIKTSLFVAVGALIGYFI